MMSDTDTAQLERRIRCSCGFHTGWYDFEDANHIADHHGANCDDKIRFKEREKTGTNHSDVLDEDYLLTVCPHCDDGKDYECEFCGKGFLCPGPRREHQRVCTGS